MSKKFWDKKSIYETLCVVAITALALWVVHILFALMTLAVRRDICVYFLVSPIAWSAIALGATAGAYFVNKENAGKEYLRLMALLLFSLAFLGASVVFAATMAFV